MSLDIGTLSYNLAAVPFFAACAYAQLNDPEPALWISAYLFGGVFLTLTALTAVHYGSPHDQLPYSDAAQLRLWTRKMSLLASLATVCVALRLLISVVREGNLDWGREFGKQPQKLAWSLLEHEAGRDACGLLLLAMHTMQLQVLTRPSLDSPSSSTVIADAAKRLHRGQQQQQRGTASEYANRSESDGGGSDGGGSGSSGSSSSGDLKWVLQKGVPGAILAGAVYLWVYYQPLMNAREDKAHCKDMFPPAG